MLYQPLYVIEFVQGLKRCEAVYVEVQQLLAYVLQDGVVQLEEVKLRNAPTLSFHPNDCRGTVVIRREDFERYLAIVGNSYEYLKL